MAVAFPIPTLIVGGIALAIAAVWKLWKNWDKISAWIGDQIDWLGDKFGGLWDGIVDAFKWAIDKLKPIWETSPLGLIFRSVGAIFDRIQSASGSTPTSAPPVGGRLLGPMAAPRQQVDVKVDLSNLPPGARAIATASDGIGFELSRGWAMPGATGSW